MTSLDSVGISPSSYLLGLQPSVCTYCLFFENLSWVWHRHILPVFPPLCPLWPGILCCLILHYGAFVFFIFPKPGSQPHFPSNAVFLSHSHLLLADDPKIWIYSPNFLMKLLTHEPNCLLYISTLIPSLKHLIHPFIPQTLNKHFLQVTTRSNISSSPQTRPPSISPI